MRAPVQPNGVTEQVVRPVARQAVKDCADECVEGLCAPEGHHATDDRRATFFRQKTATPLTPLRRLGAWLIALFCLCAVFSGSYGIVYLLSMATGPLPPLLSYVLAGLIAVLIFFGLIHIQTKAHWGSKWDFSHFGQEIMDALGRIATGDFSVRVAQDDRGPLTEVARSFNRMAQDLGTLEAQRQNFISNVSHEIQSPLTSIRGFAELLRDGDLSVADRQHYLDIIEMEAKRLSKLSDDLLKLTILESEGQLVCAPYCLAEQIRSVVLMLEPLWQEKQLEIEMTLDDISISADENLLRQVWINLIQNAVKCTPAGGSIAISLDLEDTQALVAVVDNGIGIATTDLPHIFERFYKADKSRDRSLGGNGLGLALVKRIVELHGGEVWAQSVLGEGASFWVQLPLTETMGTIL
ncbi:MAG: HAMP domain-containing histidine kinase [Coriobacteriales bacterium]|jgi:signal transduction histidine kinase|nr:HAMP domain-containing histidine kinase [Coriobacteriales bacterium]